MNVQNVSDPDVPPSESVYTRIRKVLEELGPTFVKLGQALSNREDLLPKEMVRELQLLQDQVESLPLEVEGILEDNFGPSYKNLFQNIERQPLASASIAQIYRATLANGEEVVLKIKRPNIQYTIESDLLLMKDLARILTTYFEFAEQVNLEQAVSAFEKSLLTELSFVNERENIERFSHNFRGNGTVYVPKVYPSLSNNEVLCMEFIDGAKITDKTFHKTHHLNAPQLAQKGLEIYLTQLLEHGFFHADPHAGNILLLKDGRIVFIDMGAMGHIYQADQEILEDLILHLITQNVPKLVSLLKKMALQIEIGDEKKLHDDIGNILKMVNTTSLEDLKITVLLNKFKDILFENRVMMPEYFTLLVRGLVLIESIGRTLNPEMNIMRSIEPYIERVIQKRLSPQYLLQKSVSKLSDLSQDIHNVPSEMRQILQRLHEGTLNVQIENKDLKKTNTLIKKSVFYIVLALILSANIIATALMIVANRGPFLWGMPALALSGFAFSMVLSVYLCLKMLRR